MLYCKQVVLLLVISLIKETLYAKSDNSSSGYHCRGRAQKDTGYPAKSPEKGAHAAGFRPSPDRWSEYNCAAIVEAARADYRAKHKTGIHSCRVYIKPEEQAAYYVINKVEGKVDIAPVETQ